MFEDPVESFWNILRGFGDMTNLGLHEALAVSITVNFCVVVYCVVLRVQKNITQNCCCKTESLCVKVIRAYGQKPHVLSKFVTEQLTAWILAPISIIALVNADIIHTPFSGTLPEIYRVFVPILLAVNIGRYIFMLVQDIYILHHLETSKYRFDTIHHVVACGCYGIFLGYGQNFLLALVGITMELSTTTIEVSKIAKELGYTKSEFYKNLTVVSCILAVVFRGIIPIVFLVMSMFLQTPFVMHYTVLSTFFLSIIFFSVINVWFILSAIQRLVRTCCTKSSLFRRFEANRRVRTSDQTLDANNDPTVFTKNNLGYLRRYDNKNLCYIEEEKLNTNKKTFPKENIPQVCSIERPNVNATNVGQDYENSRSEDLNNPIDDYRQRRTNSFIVRYQSSRGSDHSSSSGSALIIQTDNGANVSGSGESPAVDV